MISTVKLLHEVLCSGSELFWLGFAQDFAVKTAAVNVEKLSAICQIIESFDSGCNALNLLKSAP